MTDAPPALPSLATAGRPLAGLTILLVEDSRFASEAVRLLGLRCGARLRRADSLRAAERHLATYRPSVVLVDLGLPDGSGLDLVAALDAARPRLPAIIAVSGDEGARQAALAAGADGFVAKPVASLAAFCDAVRSALHLEAAPIRPPLPETPLSLDPLALRDDLSVASEILGDAADPRDVAYAAQFLAGLARTARDRPLEDAALSLSGELARGAPVGAHLARLAGLVSQRLHEGSQGRRLA